MARKQRVRMLVLLVLAVLIVAEAAYELLRTPGALVQIENAGTESVEDLVVTCGDSRAEVALIKPGGKAKVWVGDQRENTLRFAFRQRDSALTNYELPGFDAADLNRQNFKVVLRLSPNQIERFQDDGEPATALGRWLHGLWNQFLNAMKSHAGFEVTDY